MIGSNLIGMEHEAAAATSGLVLDQTIAPEVHESSGSISRHPMCVAPLHDRYQNRREISAGIGEPVLEPLWPPLIFGSFEYSVVDESGSRVVRRLDAMPRSSRISPNRCSPRKTARKISRDQRSPKTARAAEIESSSRRSAFGPS